MNFEELSSILKANGLNVIRIVQSSYDDCLTFDGELEDFIDVVKALNEKTVFVRILKLGSIDFLYSIDEIDNDEDISEDICLELRKAAPIDLATVYPEVRNYKKYLNTEGAFLLSIFVKNRILQHYQCENWWMDFREVRRSAIEKRKAQEKLRIEERDSENFQKDEELLNKLHQLRENADFVHFSTRKNTTLLDMKAYATKAIPELKDLSEDNFKRELQCLRSEFKAQKIQGK